MRAKVFISCGEKSPEERSLASQVANFFEEKGFAPHVAIEVHSMLDINGAIIGELKSSDYYVFINLQRERLTSEAPFLHRGSLFTNQELAIAYALEFEHLLLFNQRGTLREGLFKFIGSNAPEFDNVGELLLLLERYVGQWTPSYSRQLQLTDLRWSRDVTYDDHSSEIITEFSPGVNLAKRRQRMLLATVSNKRLGKSAIGTIARLKTIRDARSGEILPLGDQSQLKASGIPGYSHVIWPQDSATFDLIAIHLDCPKEIFLNSNHDFVWRLPILKVPGEYLLDFQIFADGFPLLPIHIVLENTGDAETTVARTSDGILARRDPLLTSGTTPGPWGAERA